MTAAPVTIEPGTVVDGKFRVERLLGHGGMGLVLEATHLSLGKRVALKVLRADAVSVETRERFAREARAAAQLPDEHIAQVSDFGETSAGEPYLVMELLTGSDLEHEIKARGPLPIAEAVDLALQACEGVADAHAAGLVHRDLKPSNLFLVRRRDGSPLVKVLDFGLSKVMAESTLTATESSFGTPQYMSPEQIRSAKYVDARSDQHALAMILYELASGRRPYAAESVTGLYVVICTAEPVPMRSHLPDVPPALEAAVLRALAKSADDRFRDLGDFAAAIAPFGGPGAAASAARVAATFGREAPPPALPLPSPATERMPLISEQPAEMDPPRSSPSPLAASLPGPPPAVLPNPPLAVAMHAPRGTLRMPVSAVQAQRDALPGSAPGPRRAKVALAASASVTALLGAALAAWWWLGAGSPPDGAPTAMTATTTAAPATAAVAAAEASSAEQAAPEVASPDPPASAPGPEGAPPPGKPLHAHPAKPAKRTVDQASDVFGQRHR
jgi:serine/threonine protein kinase